MSHSHFLAISLLFLFTKIYNFQDPNQNDVSLNYEFDYHSIVESKTSSGEYKTLIEYHGKIETSSYILTNKQELLFLKFKLFGTGELSGRISLITSIIIRKEGLVERIIIDDSSSTGLVNLLKGIVNLLSIDEKRENKVEPDVSGECFVRYELLNETLLYVGKTKCNQTRYSSSFETDLDSFSLYKESDIKSYYTFGLDESLLSINSTETHSLEPVLFQNLGGEYRSTTIIKFSALTKFLSLINSADLDDIIRIIIGENYREVFLPSTSEIDEASSEKDDLIQIEQLFNSEIKSRRSEITLKLVKLFRQIKSQSSMNRLMKTKLSTIKREIVYDAAINCGTKICSELILNELDICTKKDISEANRILLSLQNIIVSNEYLVQNLWLRVPTLPNDLYDQGIQTIASLIELSRHSLYLEPTINEVVNFIKNKISLCKEDHCYHVHLSAIKNSRSPSFQRTVLSIIENSGKYSMKVVADAFNTIWILRYNEESQGIVKNEIYQSVKNRINFFHPYVQYQSIYCLVMMEIDTELLVGVLDQLQMNNSHYQYFLMKKLKELANLGVFKDYIKILESDFFGKSRHLIFTYPEDVGSKMLVKPLFTTDNSLMDIHFNIIGSDGGIIKHGITDLFLVTTARENNVFSLSTHMSGLESYLGSGENDVTEDIEGLLQLSLFGKYMRPINLFRGTTELMSAIWNAPSDLQSVLRGTFIPIDIKSEITFQNGVVLESSYMGSVFLDISFQLSTSVWYKTALSLLRTSGNVYAIMESEIKTLKQNISTHKELTIRTGIDFQTNIDFGTSPMKNCLSISRPSSKINIKSDIFKNGNLEPLDSSRAHMKMEGLSYSLTSKMDETCTDF